MTFQSIAKIKGSPDLQLLALPKHWIKTDPCGTLCQTLYTHNIFKGLTLCKCPMQNKPMSDILNSCQTRPMCSTYLENASGLYMASANKPINTVARQGKVLCIWYRWKAL